MSQVVMSMRWRGVTPEQYEEARQVVNWEGDVPDGAVLHVAGFDSDGIRVNDVWESAEQFQAFVDGRLMQGVQQVGIEGEPEIELYPVQNVFNARVPAAA
jgi:hypothetical protein